MIKIIKGIYGYKEANGTITQKTKKDKPFELTEKQEERLVRRGVAIYVKEPEVAPVQQGKETMNLAEMPYNGLKHMAAELGISSEGKKEELVARIKEAQNEAEKVEEDGEQEPVLTPAEPE